MYYSTEEKTAILLIGFQNDYFHPSGALHTAVKENQQVNRILSNTLALLDAVKHQDMLIINIPILFSNDYHELKNPVGLMQHIKNLGAFRRDSFGGKTIEDIKQYGKRIIELEGKTGFNAFVGTHLHELLQQHQIEQVLLCGVVTSLCIDSSGRAAAEKGYKVAVAADCTGSRNDREQRFYIEEIIPLYADTIDSQQLHLAQVS
ncbi:MAG: cysteine hydrolase [Pseudomonadales bacterium]|nr:cysteine hydrolase [Pseudomonadales bacterium]